MFGYNYMNDTLPLVPLKWTSHATTHVGKVRQINEDAYLDRTDIKLWAIADGMGGHHAGDVASSNIVDALNNIKPAHKLSAFVTEIEDKLLEVNDKLRILAAEHEDNRTIGSTVVVMLAENDHCAIMWAGDSRAYRQRNDEFVQLSKDHSQVEEMIDRGILQRRDAESHPASNIITRAVGATDQLYVDVDIDEVHSGDTYLLCSDGLYKHVSEEEIAEILEKSEVSEICQTLVDLTLQRGAVDNVSVVVIRAE